MLKNKLFRIYLVRLQAVIIIPMTLLSLVFFYFSLNGQKDALLKSQLQAFDGAARNYELLFKSLYMDSSAVFYNPEIHYLLMEDSLSDRSKQLVVQEMVKRIESRIEAVDSVEVFFKKAGMVLAPQGLDVIDSKTGKDPITKAQLRNLISPKNIWIPQHQVNYLTGKSDVVTFIMPLPINSEEPLGALVVNLDARKLLNISLPRDNSKEDILVLDRNNKLMFGNVSKVYSDDLFTPDKLENIRRKNIESEILHINHQKKIIFYKPSAINEWIYVKIVPYAYIENNLQVIGGLAYILMLLVVAAGVAFAYYLAKKTYEPIGKMTNAIREASVVFTKDDESIFCSIRDKIDEISSENSDFKGFFELNSEFLRESVIKELLFNRSNMMRDVDSNLKLLGIDFPYPLYCVFIFQLEGEEEAMSSSYISVLRELIKQKHPSVFIYVKNDRICAVINLDNNGVMDNWEYLWNLGNECNRVIREQFNTSLTMGISNICCELQNIGECYEIAQKALSYRHCFEKGALIFNHMISHNSTNVFVYPFKEEIALIEFLEQANQEEANGVLSRIFDHIRAQAQFYTYDYLKLIYSTLFNSLKRNSILRTIHWNEDEFNKIYGIITENRRGIGEIEELFKGIVNEMILQANKRQDVNVSLEKAIDYINKNYTSDIALDDLAEIAGLTPQYFSKVFKEYTQNTVVNYITDLRMEKSVRMLNETDMSIKDIAEEVGYRNPQYFIRVFKKKFHLSPMQYKRR